MARQVLPIAGAIVGSFFGAPQIGFAIGSLIGNAVDPVQIQGPKIGDMAIQTSRDGVPRPIVFGIGAVAGNIIDRSEPRIVKKKERQGKGGGPETTSEHVYMSFAIRVCEGPVTSISRIWENEKLVYDPVSLPRDSTKFLEKVTFYLGDESQLPDPTLEALHGVGNTPAHRGTCYVVYNNKDLTDFGGAIPQYRFEVNGGDFGIGVDPYAANVISFLPMDSEYDEILLASWTNYGFTAFSSTGGPFGDSYGIFDDGHALNTIIGASASFAGAFTVDLFHNKGATTSDTILSFGNISLEINASGHLEYKCGAVTLTKTSYTSSVWRHIQLCRDASNTVYAFCDGVLVSTGVHSGIVGTNGTIDYGRVSGGGGYLTGKIAMARITAGICRNTANFTPPASGYHY